MRSLKEREEFWELNPRILQLLENQAPWGTPVGENQRGSIRKLGGKLLKRMVLQTVSISI